MIGKLKIVEEEVDEAGFWLEIFEESGYGLSEIAPLKRESYELLSIVVASIKTLRGS